MHTTNSSAPWAVLSLGFVLAATTAATAQAEPPPKAQTDPPATPPAQPPTPTPPAQPPTPTPTTRPPTNAQTGAPPAAQAEPPPKPQEAAPTAQAEPTPKPQAEPKKGNQLQNGQHFDLDPVTDSILISVGFGFAGLLGLVLSTGEIKPPVPGDPNLLLPIDRIAIKQKVDPSANTLSDVGLYTAIGFAVLDPVLSGFRDGWDATLVDALLYAQSISLSLSFTDVVKIAVRRPRPVDYINCSSNTNMLPPGCTSTDLGLSFFSGHAAIVSSITGTATYLAFARTSARNPRPWITLAVGTALTAFVSVERVRSGNHFPTDVIAGALSGAAIGTLIPHLHRHRNEGLPIWVGVAPSRGGGSLTLGGQM